MANALRYSGDDYSFIGEDISALMLLISQRTTPLLDALTMGPSATNILHQYRERSLNPDYVTASIAVNSATADTAVTIPEGNQLQVGMILESEGALGSEKVRVASVTSNSMLINRGWPYGTGAINTMTAGERWFIVGQAEKEGADQASDISYARVNRSNFTQIFTKPIRMTGTEQAVSLAPNLGNEFDVQTELRAIEAARELERTIIRGVSANTIGNLSNPRTMDGLNAVITAVNSAVTTSSFAQNPILYANNILKTLWGTGARDIDLIACGADVQALFSNGNQSYLNVSQQDSTTQRSITRLITDFGQPRILLVPNMKATEALFLSTARVVPVALQGRSFQRTDLAKTGDASNRAIIGEYTLETHHRDKLARLRLS